MVNRLTQLLDDVTSGKCEIVTGALTPQLSVADTCLSSAAGIIDAH
jgi:hypothetical protein